MRLKRYLISLTEKKHLVLSIFSSCPETCDDSTNWSESLILTVFACLHVRALLQIPVDILNGLNFDDTRQLPVKGNGSCPL